MGLIVGAGCVTGWCGRVTEERESNLKQAKKSVSSTEDHRARMNPPLGVVFSHTRRESYHEDFNYHVPQSRAVLTATGRTCGVRHNIHSLTRWENHAVYAVRGIRAGQLLVEITRISGAATD